MDSSPPPMIRPSLEGLDIPVAWAAAASSILGRRPRRVVVLGENDTGKSTFCRFLAAYLPPRGLRTAILDADPGQNAIGPPATLALGLDPARPAALHFIGGTNPAAHIPAMIAGVARLAGGAAVDCLVVNTTGLVHGPGLLLKQHKIDALAPDLIVALQRDGELAPLLASQAHIALVDLRPSPLARKRGAGERRQARRQGYAAAFAGARPVTMAPEHLVLQRAGPSGPPPVQAETPLLCALADGAGIVLGLALLERFEPGEPLLARTAVPAEAVRVLQFGALCLADGWRELMPSRPGAKP